jgi:hypothetical protein
MNFKEWVGVISSTISIVAVCGAVAFWTADQFFVTEAELTDMENELRQEFLLGK